MSVRALEIKIIGDGSRGSVNLLGETIDGQLVDDSGETLPVTHARCQPAAYRARYEVTARQ